MQGDPHVVQLRTAEEQSRRWLETLLATIRQFGEQNDLSRQRPA